MAPTVYFFTEGQLGNNLFQYFAAELIKKIYGYEEAKITLTINLEFNLVIDDEKFKTIITRYMEGNPVPLDTTRDILLMGFFQRSEIFEYERDYLLSLWNSDNTHYVNRNVQIKNIVNYQTKHTMEPTPRDLTLHLRLGDFATTGVLTQNAPTSQIYDPAYLKALIQSIPHERLFIVHQKPKEDWEKEYEQHFDELNPIWIHGNLGDDFDFLMRSPTLITSASTLCWMAAFLGKGTSIHIPYNHAHGGKEGTGQNLDEYSLDCKVYYDVPTYTNACKS